MNEILIESNEDALIEFKKIVEQNEEASFIEETQAMDGQNIISLVIENLPEIINSVVALIAILKSKKISFRITKEGNEIESIEEA